MQHTPLFLMLDARVHCLRDPRTASTRAHPRNFNGESVAEARGPSFLSCLMRVSIALATKEQPTREHTPEILMGILSRRLEDTDRPRPHPPLTMDAGPSRNMWPDPH